MTTLGMTQSVCPTCRQVVPAKIVAEGADVRFRKFCPAHGESVVTVSGDVDAYLRAARYVKPAWTPRAFAGDATRPCPDGCGFCSRHEQHLCMPIVEITTRCDLACPACLVDAGGDWDMTLAEFRAGLDRLIEAEGQIDILNFSGGEPLLHPQLIEFVDEAVGRPSIVRVSVSTNGLPFLRQPGLLDQLVERNVCISLQFDGFDDITYTLLRGRPMLAEKLRILDMLADRQARASLTVTLARGVNEDQLPAILDYYFAQPHLISLMIQPIALVGRAKDLPADYRLSTADVARLLGQAGDPRVQVDDFTPLPCSHPRCFSLAYYLMLDGGGCLSLGRMVQADRLLDTVANRTVFGLDPAEHERLRDLVYELWSGPAASAPDGANMERTLRSILQELTCPCNARGTFGLLERRVKSIFIHAFQDAGNFDLARVRRCCNGYLQPDGRLIPACAHNVLTRPRVNEREDAS